MGDGPNRSGIPALSTAAYRARHEHRRRLLRIGWLLPIGIVALALGGLFGSGPLSRSVVGNDAIQLTYPRFARRDAAFELHVRVSVPTGAARADIALPRAYLARLRIEGLVPPPASSVVGARDVVFAFALEAPTPGIDVVMSLKPTGIGRLEGEIGAAGNRVAFTQLVWP